MLTVSRLRELLEYDAASGLFRWLESRGCVSAGSIAGSIDDRGYVLIKLDKVTYKAHRLAWLYANGDWPGGELDHFNCDPSDNRIENLRVATHAQNMANVRAPKNNTSGMKGVRRRGRGFSASIRGVCLGTYSSADEAQSAYREAANTIYGEFARAA